jgi:hypothetical protein
VSDMDVLVAGNALDKLWTNVNREVCPYTIMKTSLTDDFPVPVGPMMLDERGSVREVVCILKAHAIITSGRSALVDVLPVTGKQVILWCEAN